MLLTMLGAASQSAWATVGVGDIAVVGYNSDGSTTTKDFAVVTLATINSGETIFITDKGWTATSGGSFMADITTEGIFSWTTTGVIKKGTVIRFAITSGASPSVVSSPAVGTLTVVNGWTSTATASPFGTNGDQVLIYQGSLASPTFIFGFNAGNLGADVVNGWNTTATSGNSLSNLPTGLANGTNAIGFPTTTVSSLDNYAYTGAVGGTKADMLARICNRSNWGSDDAVTYDLVPGSATGSFPGTNPIFNTVPTASAVSHTGTLELGETLTGAYTYTDTDGDAETGSTFKWFRSDNGSGLNKVQLAPVTKTYVLTAADVNKFISFQVTVNDGSVAGTAVESALRGPISGTLPVRLIDFSAKADAGNSVRLTWRVAQQRNNKAFIIHRKGDGGEFTKVGEVAAGVAEIYTFTDRFPRNGNNYYRLSQLDDDGTMADLAEGAAHISFLGGAFAAYPNPTTGTATVDLGAGRFERAELTDLSGKVMATKKISAGEERISFDLSSSPKGVYLIRIIGNGETIVRKVSRK